MPEHARVSGHSGSGHVTDGAVQIIPMRVASRFAYLAGECRYQMDLNCLKLCAKGKASSTISSRNAGLGRGRDDDARVVCSWEAGASRRELLVVALLLNVQEHGEQAHDAHTRNQTWRGEALFERVDGLTAGVDAEAAVRVRRHCVGEFGRQWWW